jgi:flagellar M-ring protein FliF
MEPFKGVFKGATDFIGRMTPSQVMMLFGVVAGTIVGIIFLSGWLKDINYARLYSNLESAEAGEIVNYLNTNNVPYQIADNGGSIDIPSDQVYKVRLALASQGVPKAGTVGYSIFDQNNLGMTDFLQNLNFRRALEGELTKTIMQLSEVQAARVHIVIPKDRLFKEDKKEPTASVVLKLRNRAGLAKAQLAGISHLVASSVEGLNPENISIIDYDGNLLSGGQARDQLAGLSTSQLEVRQNVESYLQNKAQSMLDGVLGAGKALVRVTADLNFQQLERTSESFDADKPSVRSEERTTSSSATSDKAEQARENTQEDNSQTVVTNYELNKTVEHLVNAVGTIQRLSVAVTIDGSYQTPKESTEGGEKVYQPRSQEELDRLAGIVKNAVGFDTQRNDQIEIINVPFDREQVEVDREALDTMYQRDMYMEIGKKVGIVLLVLLALLYLKRKSKKLFAALGRILPPPGPARAYRSEPGMPADEEPQVIVAARRPRLVDQMKATAKEKPEEIAKVIKTMMIE